MEAFHNKGPIPRGKWKIGEPHRHPHLGPLVMNLTPVGHQAYNRKLFRIHGNNQEDNASHGCIILHPGARRRIAHGSSRDLEVVR